MPYVKRNLDCRIRNINLGQQYREGLKKQWNQFSYLHNLSMENSSRHVTPKAFSWRVNGQRLGATYISAVSIFFCFWLVNAPTQNWWLVSGKMTSLQSNLIGLAIHARDSCDWDQNKSRCLRKRIQSTRQFRSRKRPVAIVWRANIYFEWRWKC